MSECRNGGDHSKLFVFNFGEKLAERQEMSKYVHVKDLKEIKKVTKIF